MTDLSKAPAGATHIGKQHCEGMVAWYQYLETSGTWYFWYSENGVLDVGGWQPVLGTPIHLPMTALDGYVAPPIRDQGSIVDKLMTELSLPPYQGFRELLEELHKRGYLQP